jgi:putative acetyltransferase
MIRFATPDDAEAIATLYHDTVKRINSRDYGVAQIQAWAGATPNEAKWRARQATRKTFVEEEEEVIRGFAELEDGGQIGAVYVHADYQGQGVASALLERVQAEATADAIDCLCTDASITAQPFFEKRGFETITTQEVEYAGELFRNYRMRKKMPNKSLQPTAGRSDVQL